MEILLKEENVEAEIIIIDQLEEWITKHTWILPTIIVNDKIVSRGYMPEKQKILTELN
jgi:disulfide oxidoreductase YuzD